MGKYDSSLTRVKPIFDKLLDIDSTGETWVNDLINLAEYGHPNAKYLPISSPIINYKWGVEEAELAPPVSLLSWLVRNLSEARTKRPTGDGLTSERRKKLYDKDPRMIKKALHKIQTGESNDIQEWYILEGMSRPDAFITFDDAIIVVEGKRTEPSATKQTTWMDIRHQMLRHLDTAWEIKGNRNLYGLLIVEGDNSNAGEVPPKWIEAALKTHSDRVVRGSLPHRGPKEQELIASCFHGVLTWQMISNAFSIEWDSIPDTI